VFERAGMAEVRTYINSGNVVFSTDSPKTTQLARTLESAIEDAFGFSVRVLVRDALGMKTMLDALPPTWSNDESAKCDVILLGEEVDSPKILEQFTIKPEIDDVRYVPGAVFWRVDRANITRSGLLKLVGTELYAQTTVRNCNTVRKLAGMVQ
ncbi:MAG TPA: DUF1697 domain-containing protein, partial [Coriobacteriia bacterium]|nr:DUF1697 domain-containing protein [Coriobacteriia bacterium]